MKEFKYVITDPEGIHARPAGELVKATKEFQSAITLTKDGKTGDCKRIFGIMGLAVKAGNEITLTFDGSSLCSCYGICQSKPLSNHNIIVGRGEKSWKSTREKVYSAELPLAGSVFIRRMSSR